MKVKRKLKTVQNKLKVAEEWQNEDEKYKEALSALVESRKVGVRMNIEQTIRESRELKRQKDALIKAGGGHGVKSLARRMGTKNAVVRELASSLQAWELYMESDAPSYSEAKVMTWCTGESTPPWLLGLLEAPPRRHWAHRWRT